MLGGRPGLEYAGVTDKERLRWLKKKPGQWLACEVDLGRAGLGCRLCSGMPGIHRAGAELWLYDLMSWKCCMAGSIEWMFPYCDKKVGNVGTNRYR